MRGPIIAPDRGELAHREIHVVAGVEIAHGRDTGLERAARVVLREEHGDRRQAPLPARPRARRAIPVIGDVRVQIDQAGKAGVLPQVDDLRAGAGPRRCRVPTAVMRSPSTTTTASVVTFDPSQSLPNRIAFVCACACTEDAKASDMTSGNQTASWA